jgi:hypothetical protein
MMSWAIYDELKLKLWVASLGTTNNYGFFDKKTHKKYSKK